MRTLRNLGVVSSIAIASAAAAQDAVQWRVEDGGNGHWYGVLTNPAPLSWDDALKESIRSGGSLCVVTSNTEWAFVRSLSLSSGLAKRWLGASRDSGSLEWSWVTGEALEFTAWGSVSCPSGPYPNNLASDRVALGIADYCDMAWDDYLADSVPGGEPVYSFVVEWSADCNGDGIVDYGQIRSGDLTDADGDNIPDCCRAEVSCDETLVQWVAGAGANGHWYELVEGSAHITWQAAQAIADSRGGYLATLTGPEENFLVFSLVPTRLHEPGPWIGGFQPAGSMEPAGGWKWVTGEPLTWTNWNGLAPNNDFCGLLPEDKLHFFNRFGEWNDLSEVPDGCIPPMRSFVIEYSADCNSDGIVDFGQVRSGELRDLNANFVPDCCEGAASCGCLSDLDASGAVNGVDLAIILNTWGTNGGKYPQADIDGDGTVGGADLALVLGAWGECQ